MPDDMRADWTLDFLLACAGMTDTRAPDLLCFLAPPWVRFGDGAVWTPGADFDQLVPRKQIVPDLGPIPGLRPQYPPLLEQIELRLGANQGAVLLGTDDRSARSVAYPLSLILSLSKDVGQVAWPWPANVKR